MRSSQLSHPASTRLCLSDLIHTIRTGQPAAEQLYGEPFFSWLSHHPEQALRILRNIAAASGSGARLLLIEFVVPPGDTPHMSKSTHQITVPSQQTLLGSPRPADHHGIQVTSHTEQVIRLPTPATPRLPQFQHSSGSAFC